MSIWKNRNFAILFSGQIVSYVGDNLFGIALLWYVLDLTHSKADVAITGFATTLPPLFGLIAGVFVDRWRKRTTMLSADLVRGTLLLTLYFISSGAHASFWVIVGLVVVIESIGTFFDPAGRALLTSIVPKEQFSTATGLMQSCAAAASLVGLLAGGALLGILGAPLLFLSDAISFYLSSGSLLLMKVEEPGREEKADKQSLFAELKEGLSAIRQSRYLIMSGFTATINNFSLAGFGVAITVYVKDVLHGQAIHLGLIMAAMMVGMVIGGLFVTKVLQRVSYRTLGSVSLIFLGLGDSCSGLIPSPFWSAFTVFIAGLALGFVDGAGGAARMAVVPSHVRGRVFSTLGTMGRMATPVGAAVLGVLLVHIPVWIVLAMTGLGPIIGGLVFWLPSSSKAFREIDRAFAA